MYQALGTRFPVSIANISQVKLFFNNGLCNAFDLATFSSRFREPLRQVVGQIGAVVFRPNIQIGNKLRRDSDHCAKLRDWHSGPPRNLFSARCYE
jgi:hypothetical protein